MIGSLLISDYIQYMMPEIMLFSLASLILLLGPFVKKITPWALISSLGFLLAYFLLVSQKRGSIDPSLLFSINILEDMSSNFIRHFSLGMGLYFCLLFWRDCQTENTFETFALLMFLVTGCSIVGISNDLVVLFLGLELISIPTYVLLYLHGKKDLAAESAMKYFFLSIFSSGLLFLIPMLAILAGLGFKISMVPFHFYAPDVYQGTTYRMCALLATVSKVAGFAAIIRIFGFALAQGALPGSSKTLDNIYVLFWILSAVTMTIGTILGLLQRNLRRILAYSSISHSGYILAGIAVAPKLELATGIDGIGASFFYLIAYFFGTFGIFAVLDVLDTKEKPIEDWDDLAGIGSQTPLLAICLAVFLFSLIGIPFTGGFLAKFFIVFGCVSVPYTWDDALSKGTHNLFFLLGIIAFLNAAVGSWIYLRILSGIYFKPAIWPRVFKTSFRPSYLPIIGCVFIVLALGMKPNLVFNLNILKGMAQPLNSVSLSGIEIPKPSEIDVVLKRQ